MLNPGFMTGDEFIDRFVRDYIALEGLGYSKADILRMLGTQQYIKDFCDTPQWIEIADKLPKGCKWSDGHKFREKPRKRSDCREYILLPAGDDLYIKGLLDKMYATGYKDAEGNIHARNDVECTRELKILKLSNKRICVIRDWKSIPANRVIIGLSAVMTPLLQDAILTVWHENDVPLGLMKRVLR